MATWYTHGRKCDRRWKTHRAEHCPACHETFSGTKTGDAHRVGEHGVTEGPNRRRCLPPSEVRIKRGKRGTFGLKWNEERQYWQEDDPYVPFRDVGTPSNSVQDEVRVAEAQGEEIDWEIEELVASGDLPTRALDLEEAELEAAYAQCYEEGAGSPGTAEDLELLKRSLQRGLADARAGRVKRIDWLTNTEEEL